MGEGERTMVSAARGCAGGWCCVEREFSGIVRPLLLSIDFFGDMLRSRLRLDAFVELREGGYVLEELRASATVVVLDMPCRQDSMRSLPAIVEVDLRGSRRLVKLGFEASDRATPALVLLLENSEARSSSLCRLDHAQSCRKTLILPEKSAVTMMLPSLCPDLARYCGDSFGLSNSDGVWTTLPVMLCGREEECTLSAPDRSAWLSKVIGGGLQIS